MNKVFLGGMSDGSLMTLSIAEKLDKYTEEPLAGIVALSGAVTALPTKSECHPFSWPLPSDSLKNTPIFIYNGLLDHTVPTLLSYLSYIILLPRYFFSGNLNLGLEPTLSHHISNKESEKVR